VILHYLQALFLPTALHTLYLNEQEAQLSQRNEAYYV